MTRAQFVTQIWLTIAREWRMTSRDALPFARQAYRDHIREIAVPFGHPDYAWDEVAAREIAHEYVLRHGE